MGLQEITPSLRNPLTGEGELMIGGMSGAASRLARPDYDRTLRRSGPTLVFGRTKEAHLNDRADIDASGVSDMGATINTYLAEFAANGVTRVYGESDSIYLTSTTITIPAHVVVEGAQSYYNAGANQVTEFRASANSVTMLLLQGRHASLHGVRLNLNNKTSAVAVRPNGIENKITRCHFSNIPATSTGVKGGGLLYFSMLDNEFTGVSGRAVDLLDAYADDPSVVYYGVNVGWFERNIFGGREGSFRAEGIFTVRDNDFEGGAGYDGPAVEVSTASASSRATIDDNYFEMTGNSQGILLGQGSAGIISGNSFNGVQATVGGYGLKADGYVYSLTVAGNNFNRFEAGIILTATVTTGSGASSVMLTGNNFFNCTTKVSGAGSAGRYSGSSNTTNDRPTMLLHKGDGRIAHDGALVGGCILWSDATGLTLDLRQGNVFHLNMTTGGTLTHTNGWYGQRFALYFQTGTITLADATWNLASGVDETPTVGTVKSFIVDYNGVVREVGPLA